MSNASFRVCTAPLRPPTIPPIWPQCTTFPVADSSIELTQNKNISALDDTELLGSSHGLYMGTLVAIVAVIDIELGIGIGIGAVY